MKQSPKSETARKVACYHSVVERDSLVVLYTHACIIGNV